MLKFIGLEVSTAAKFPLLALGSPGKANWRAKRVKKKKMALRSGEIVIKKIFAFETRP